MTSSGTVDRIELVSGDRLLRSRAVAHGSSSSENDAVDDHGSAHQRQVQQRKLEHARARSVWCRRAEQRERVVDEPAAEMRARRRGRPGPCTCSANSADADRDQHERVRGRCRASCARCRRRWAASGSRLCRSRCSVISASAQKCGGVQKKITHEERDRRRAERAGDGRPADERRDRAGGAADDDVLRRARASATSCR